MRCRNSACRRATTTRNSVKAPARSSTSLPNPEETGSTATFSSTPDPLHRHQFGGTIGGPVIIPHFSTGARTQFFFGYQHTLYHLSSTTGITTVPTLAEEGRAPGISYADYGNLCNTASGNSFNASGLCVNAGGVAVPAQQISNPFTNVAYPLNRIPASDFSPASAAYEKVFPTYPSPEAPGVIGGQVNFLRATVQDRKSTR